MIRFPPNIIVEPVVFIHWQWYVFHTIWDNILKRDIVFVLITNKTRRYYDNMLYVFRNLADVHLIYICQNYELRRILNILIFHEKIYRMYSPFAVHC